MMVPHVADSPRRVDKTAVLRFSAHTLRINYGKFRPFCSICGWQSLTICVHFSLNLVFGRGNESSQLSINRPTTDALLNLINGFLLTVTCRGNIVVISPSIEQHLGHCQVSGRNCAANCDARISIGFSALFSRLLSCSIVVGGERTRSFVHCIWFSAFTMWSHEMARCHDFMSV